MSKERGGKKKKKKGTFIVALSCGRNKQKKKRVEPEKIVLRRKARCPRLGDPGPFT